MPLMSRACSHEGCDKLVFARDKCHLHDGSKVPPPKKKKRSPIDMSRRTMSTSRDGTTKRAYKQCTHDGCGNIAKKSGKCYSHGAPRRACSVEECNNKAQKHGLCRKHFKAPQNHPSNEAEQNT